METEVAVEAIDDDTQVEKRTRRRVGNKSIIQSAIARKERSLRLDERPRKRLSKAKPLAAEPAKRPSKKRPVKTESECDLDASSTTSVRYPLCKCTENKQVFMGNVQGSQFCTAVDGIGDKLIGCCRLVNAREVPMSRASVRMPFGVLCPAHQQRLIKHNCCPTCGVFCTQGRFAQCPAEHHFHKDCQQEGTCPHCADPAPSTDIVITMHSPKEPVFLPVQRSLQESARMTMKLPTESGGPEAPIIPPVQLQAFSEAANVRLDECNQAGLVEAIERGATQRAAVILETGNVDLRSKLVLCNGGTFLHLAVSKGALSIVYLLVSCGVDLDVLDADQTSALMLAVADHRNDVVKYLVTAGAHVPLKGIDGMTALHTAAKSGNLDACRILIQSSWGVADAVNAQDDGGWTPLVWACEHGFSDVARLLISHGADIHTRDLEQNVALHWAAFKGSTDTVELLLNLNSDVNVLNVHGDTPLHMAAREDRYNCTVALLSRHADISLVNKNSETALDCAPKDSQCFVPLALNAQMHFALSNNAPRRPSLLANDISNGREPNPIQCCNDVDAAPEPKDYTYIVRSCVTSDSVQIDRKVSTMRCCACQDRCASCECSCAERSSVRRWYDQGKLCSDFNFLDPPLIFECNDLCGCNAILCTNRLVQKPLTQRFQLFKTESKGWGVKTLSFIGLGHYVCEYMGEILSDLEAESRVDDSYLFDLDNRDTDSFCIDAKFYGNFSRFINHSCAPNLHPVKVFVEHQDLRFPRIALFAKRDIAVNEEISFDYGDKFWLVKSKTITCQCRTDSCKYSKEKIAATFEKYRIMMQPIG